MSGIKYDEQVLYELSQDVGSYLFANVNFKEVVLDNKLKRACFLNCKMRLSGFSVATANAKSVESVYKIEDPYEFQKKRSRVNVLSWSLLKTYKRSIVNL